MAAVVQQRQRQAGVVSTVSSYAGPAIGISVQVSALDSNPQVADAKDSRPADRLTI